MTKHNHCYLIHSIHRIQGFKCTFLWRNGKGRRDRVPSILPLWPLITSQLDLQFFSTLFSNQCESSGTQHNALWPLSQQCCEGLCLKQQCPSGAGQIQAAVPGKVQVPRARPRIITASSEWNTAFLQSVEQMDQDIVMLQRIQNICVPKALNIKTEYLKSEKWKSTLNGELHP